MTRKEKMKINNVVFLLAAFIVFSAMMLTAFGVADVFGAAAALAVYSVFVAGVILEV